MPRAFANVSKAGRAALEGGSRTKTGANIVNYDVRDPQQAAEVIGMGMGYMPYRQSYTWEQVMAQHDAAKMIDIQRTQIMGQFGNAMLGKDPEEKQKMREAVRYFNSNLQGPERAKAITSESLEKSVETKAKDRALQAQGLSPKTSERSALSRRDGETVPRSKQDTDESQTGYDALGACYLRGWSGLRGDAESPLPITRFHPDQPLINGNTQRILKVSFGHIIAK